jgi:hypothetical protein
VLRTYADVDGIQRIDSEGNVTGLGGAGEEGGSIEDHETAPNPHPTYETSTEAQAKVDAHASDTTAVHGIADASFLDTIALRDAAIAAAIAALIASAPGALNTLDELAAAFGDDANFAATMTTALAGKQPIDSDLTAIAALTTTAYGRALLELVDAAAGRTALGLGTAATHATGDYQPVDSDLTAIAALTTTSFGRALLELADAGALQTAAGISTFVKTILDDADAAAVRATIGADVSSATNPELEVPTAGTTIDMSGAAVGTGVTATDIGDGLTLVKFTNDTHQHWDVSHAIGTGDFDLRCRIISVAATDLTGITANGYGGLVVTDSSRTAGSRQICTIFGPGGAVNPYIRAITNAGFVSNPAYAMPQFPIVLRIARVGTNLTFYFSVDEGRTWTKLVTLGSVSTDFQKVGLNATNNTGGNPQFVVDRIWLA